MPPRLDCDACGAPGGALGQADNWDTVPIFRRSRCWSRARFLLHREKEPKAGGGESDLQTWIKLGARGKICLDFDTHVGGLEKVRKEDARKIWEISGGIRLLS